MTLVGRCCGLSGSLRQGGVGLEWVRAAVPPIARAWYLAGPEVHAGDDSVLVLWGQEAYSVVVAESPLDFGLRG